MPDVVTGALGGLSVVSGILGRNTAKQGAAQASDAQTQGAELGIAETRRQFDAMQELLKPYLQAGTGALGRLSPYETAGAGQLGTLGQYAGAGSTALQQQQALTGALGPEAQAAAISSIEQSPQMQAMIQQGENAMLQNASATGGLRGGNVQAAMAQFRPQILSGLIDQQYNRLGGLSSMGGNIAQNLASLGATTTQNIATLGQSSAVKQGVAGLESAKLIGTGYADIGASQAGRAKAEQEAQGNFQSGLFGIGGQAVQGLGSLFSDVRLKRNIKRLGTRPDGLNVYEYEYIWGGGRHIGLMAQEVNAVYPHAVGVVDGYLTVNYSQV